MGVGRRGGEAARPSAGRSRLPVGFLWTPSTAGEQGHSEALSSVKGRFREMQKW